MKPPPEWSLHSKQCIQNCNIMESALVGFHCNGNKTSSHCCALYQGLCSLSGKRSYRQISWSLKAMILDVIMIILLWNLTGTLAALLLRCLSNFRATGISWLRGFTRSCGKTSYCLVNRGPDVKSTTLRIHYRYQDLYNIVPDFIMIWKRFFPHYW